VTCLGRQYHKVTRSAAGGTGYIGIAHRIGRKSQRICSCQWRNEEGGKVFRREIGSGMICKGLGRVYRQESKFTGGGRAWEAEVKKKNQNQVPDGAGLHLVVGLRD